MSETRLLKTDSSSHDGESVSVKPNRLLGWISNNRWYLAGSLLVLIMARSEAHRVETPTMRQNRQTIEEMSRVERDRLRHNYEQYQKLSRQDVQRVKFIHDAADKEPQLAETISRFHSWLATLSLPDREKLLATSNPEDRLQIIRQLQAEAESPHSREDVRPTLDMAMRNQFANLRVPLHDYERMMRAGAKWAELPSTPTEKTSLGQLEYHASALAAIMDKVLPGWRIAINRAGNRPRPNFPDELREVLLEQLSDSNIKRTIQGRPAMTQNFMAVTLLARGLFDETRRVAMSLHPNEAELDRVLRALPEARRKSITDMPEELRDRYLQQMWVTRRLSPEAGQSLSQLWIMFDKFLSRPPGVSGNGFGAGRPGPDGGGGFRSIGKPSGQPR
ncbi:MAG: hypothetical protein HQ518_31650 [Rhodopirellula sp.]|nr:hypothetical protein [Rhodopirellula sp.]